MLIKMSLISALAALPTLRVGSRRNHGVMDDTAGMFRRFRATDCSPGRRYTLSLVGANGKALCAPLDPSTFPDPQARQERLRLRGLI